MRLWHANYLYDTQMAGDSQLLRGTSGVCWLGCVGGFPAAPPQLWLTVTEWVLCVMWVGTMYCPVHPATPLQHTTLLISYVHLPLFGCLGITFPQGGLKTQGASAFLHKG